MGVGEGVNVKVGCGVKVAVGVCVDVGVAVDAGANEEQEERINTSKNMDGKMWLILFRMDNILPLVVKNTELLMQN